MENCTQDIAFAFSLASFLFCSYYYYPSCQICIEVWPENT